MWKCIRCEKENQDLAEQCENCGHGRTMDYTGHRVVSKLETEMIGAWKYDQNDPEYIRKQAVEHLQKAVELLVKSGLSGSAEKTKKVITEVKKASGLNKNFNIQMVENDHQTEQNISPFRYGGQNVLGADDSPKEEKRLKNNHQTEQNISPFRYGGQNVLGADDSPKEEKRLKNNHQTEQNISPFRYGGQNVLGQKESDTDRKKTQSRKRKISSKISKKELRVLNQSDLDNYKDKRNYTGKTIEEICQNFLSYEDLQHINTGQKDNIINTLKIPSDDKIYLIHDDSWFKRGIEGFAVTSRGIYSRQARCQEVFISWKEFKECTEITTKGRHNAILLDKKEIFTGFYDTLHIELLFISLYKMLNAEKPVVDIGEFDFEKSLLKLLDEEDSDADMDDIDFEKKLEESLRDL